MVYKAFISPITLKCMTQTFMILSHSLLVELRKLPHCTHSSFWAIQIETSREDIRQSHDWKVQFLPFTFHVRMLIIFRATRKKSSTKISHILNNIFFVMLCYVMFNFRSQRYYLKILLFQTVRWRLPGHSAIFGHLFLSFLNILLCPTGVIIVLMYLFWSAGTTQLCNAWISWL